MVFGSRRWPTARLFSLGFKVQGCVALLSDNSSTMPGTQTHRQQAKAISNGPNSFTRSVNNCIARTTLLIFALTLVTWSSGLTQTPAHHHWNISYHECMAIIEEDIRAQNDHDTTTFLSLRTDTCGAQNRNIFRKLWREKPGSNFMLNLISAKLVGLKRIPFNVARNFFQLETLTKCYRRLACFYVAIDYRLKRETTYMYDGTNYRLYMLGYQKHRWSVLEASQAPIESIRKWGYGFETEEERAAEKIQLLKQETGKSFDMHGKQINPDNNNEKWRHKYE